MILIRINEAGTMVGVVFWWERRQLTLRSDTWDRGGTPDDPACLVLLFRF